MNDRDRTIRAAFFEFTNSLDYSLGEAYVDYSEWLRFFTAGYEACEKINLLTVNGESTST